MNKTIKINVPAVSAVTQAVCGLLPSCCTKHTGMEQPKTFDLMAGFR
jgi:hypothetical protein